MLSFIKLLLLICLQIYQIQKKGKKCKPKQVIKANNNRLVVHHIVNGYQAIPKRKEITVAYFVKKNLRAAQKTYSK